MTKQQIIDKAVTWARNIAANPAAGYSQQVRWGPSYDCSSLLIQAWETALNESGQNGPKFYGASYTGNMKPAFIACGFADVTAGVNLATGFGLEKGDILLNVVNHTAMAINPWRIVHARSSEGTYDTIDNSGNEIREQAYWNYPWDCVLRYVKEEKETMAEELTYIVRGGDTLGAIALRYGTTVDELVRLNGILNKNVIQIGMKLKIREAEKEPEETIVAEEPEERDDDQPVTREYILGLISAEMEAHNAKMRSLLDELQAAAE